MSKVEANIVTIKSSTSSKVLKLKSELGDVMSVVSQVNLPFSCSEVGIAKSYVSQAVDCCGDFHSVLIDSADFCASTDENFSTELSKIDDWSSTAII